MDFEKAGMKYARQKSYEKIILQYLFLTNIEGELSDEIIFSRYKIKPYKIRSLYGCIPQEEKEKIEVSTKERIQRGELSLYEYSLKLFKEALKKSSKVQKNENKYEEER